MIDLDNGPEVSSSRRQFMKRLIERHTAQDNSRCIEVASSMTWKSVNPVVEFIDKVYCKGVTLTKQAFRKLNQLLRRQAGIEKWSVIIEPQLSNSAP